MRKFIALFAAFLAINANAQFNKTELRKRQIPFFDSIIKTGSFVNIDVSISPTPLPPDTNMFVYVAQLELNNKFKFDTDSLKNYAENVLIKKLIKEVLEKELKHCYSVVFIFVQGLQGFKYVKREVFALKEE